MGTARKHFSCGTSVRVVAASIIAASFAGAAHATTFNNQTLLPPGFYNGSGNSSDGFVVDRENGIELGLGVNYRYIGPVAPDGDSSTYKVNTGFFTDSSPGKTCQNICSLWNFDFSLNLRASEPNASLTLADVTGNFTIQDVATGTSISFPPTVFPDNAGYNGTGHHTPATGADWGAQNSENLAFILPGFDPTKDDTYIISFVLSDSATQTQLGFVSETIVAGAGAPTPLPAALPLFASGLGVFGYFARRKKNKRGAVGALA